LEKKDKDGQYVDDADLTEAEIKQVLYQLAVGEKTLATQKKAAEKNNDDQNNQATTEQK